MTTLNPSPADLGERLQAELSAVDIDSRCAAILARVALDGLASVSDAHRSAIVSALDDEIAGQRLEQGDTAEAVVSLLTEVKLRLRAGPAKVVYID
jgi:hypothetical protein